MPEADKMGRTGQPCLWTLGEPYRMPGLAPCGRGDVTFLINGDGSSFIEFVLSLCDQF